MPRLAPFDFLLYAIVVVAWGTSWIGMKPQVETIAAEISVMWRFLAAGAIMMAIAAWRGEKLAYSAADHLRFALMGLFLFSTNFILFYHASALMPSGLLAVVFSLASIVNLALSALIFRQTLDRRVLLGAALGALGVALLFGPELLRAELGQAATLGLAGSLVGTLSFCFGNLASGDSQKRGVAVIPAAAFGMLYGVAFSALAALVLGRAFTIDWSLRYIGSLLFLVLSASVIAFSAYLTLLGRIGAGRAGYATVMFPLVALAVSTVAEGYRWTWIAATGATLALMGNVLVLRRTASPAPAKSLEKD